MRQDLAETLLVHHHGIEWAPRYLIPLRIRSVHIQQLRDHRISLEPN